MRWSPLWSKPWPAEGCKQQLANLKSSCQWSCFFDVLRERTSQKLDVGSIHASSESGRGCLERNFHLYCQINHVGLSKKTNSFPVMASCRNADGPRAMWALVRYRSDTQYILDPTLLPGKRGWPDGHKGAVATRNCLLLLLVLDSDVLQYLCVPNQQRM